MANALRSRLNPAFRDVLRKCQVVTRNPSNVVLHCRYFATRDGADDEEISRPTKYTTSKANAQSAQAARESVTRDNSPWLQQISLMLSLAAFLIYFGCLREENDLDVWIDSDVSDKVPALKEVNEKMKTRVGRDAARRSLGFQ